LPFDIRESIRLVNDFIDELETIEVAKEKIDESVKNNRCGITVQ